MTTSALPRIGFGTWQVPRSVCKAAVLKAIQTGYRHIDTAQLYGNEAEVGDALVASGVPRDQVVVATKIRIVNLPYRRVHSSFARSLRKLKTDYVDILYVHWPFITYRPEGTLKAICELVDLGMVRHIGVSNFPMARVEQAIAVCGRHGKSIFANQVEHHPLLRQERLRAYLGQKGIHLVAYSPILRGRASAVPVISEIAAKHGVSAARVCLAWEMAHGAIPIPKATSEGHVVDNFGALDLTLDSEDLARIDAIRKKRRLVTFPLLHPRWD